MLLRGASRVCFNAQSLDLVLDLGFGFGTGPRDFVGERHGRCLFGGAARVLCGPFLVLASCTLGLFANAIEASTVLGVDEPLRGEMQAALAKLPPYRVGGRGQLLEWSEDFEEVEPHHRHMSHLVGLHPGRSITPQEAPAHFGWMAMFATHDVPASSALTREKLGWRPVGPGLIADIEATAA